MRIESGASDADLSGFLTAGKVVAWRYGRRAAYGDRAWRPLSRLPLDGYRDGAVGTCYRGAIAVTLVSTAWSSALGQIRGGQIIPIAVSSDARLGTARQTIGAAELDFHFRPGGRLDEVC